MAAKRLDFNKLSQTKRYIVTRASVQPYVGTMTYAKEKAALRKAGWLESYIDGSDVITSLLRLTEQGRAALNAHKLLQHHRAGDAAKLVEMVTNEADDATSTE